MVVEEFYARTKLCGIMGNPVSHSLSPAMQNAAFRAEGSNIFYAAFEVEKEGLAEAVAGARQLGYLGFNVTIPHKIAVMDYLDEIDERALKIGSVNTVVNRNGLLKGYNTDSSGLIEALESGGATLKKNKKALIIGSGGSARTAGFTLAEKGLDLLLMNRTVEKAERLAEDLSKITDVEVAGENIGKQQFDDISIVINCTPVGMTGGPFGSPLKKELIHEGMFVMDMVYKPMITPLLSNALERGARVVHGYRMLVGQGAASFELWTRKKAPRPLMERTVIELLGGGA
jgi:shikimate dehydrogenase